PRAKVFMGDVGSILLGFVFAGLAVTLARDFLETICLAAFLFPFYADELTTMAIRLRDRENLLKPHRRHLYQLLVNQLGIAHWKITVLYGVVQLLVGTAMLIAYPYGFKPVLIILAFGFGGFTLLGGWVRRLLPPVQRMALS
ncbi:MAG: hypothetical protein FWE89_06680, partial [Syntrophaceae bacterium]|nr:hypothetical protein [Syntrophaceae bacterium]